MAHHTFSIENEKAASFKHISVHSPAFKENEHIPDRYTCRGADISPALDLNDFPKEAESLALIMDDPDAPGGDCVHWVIWNIPVTHHLKEGHVSGVQGKNDFGNQSYNGPCPPGGTHHYFFKVYALDCILDLSGSANKQDLEKAMSGHITGFGELTGLYKKE